MRRRILQFPLMPEHWRWATFEKIAPPNCRRYYRIAIEPAAEEWAVVTDRGRIGKPPRRMIEVAETIGEAEAIAQKRARDRLLHKYSLTDVGV